MSGKHLSFGAFVFDVEACTLHEDGRLVEIGTKESSLLAALLKFAGQTVSKSTLMDAVWPNATVEESNLTVQIAALRKRLGNTHDGGEWIVTVPRVGYRFVRGALPDLHVNPLDAAQSPVATMAVLPFENMSSDPEQVYFAEGLAEDLITDLSKVPGLTVIARNSSFAYKGRQLDTRTMATELGVRYLIEGSVRRAAGRVRINAQVIDAVHNRHIWADRFDRDLADVFALQDEIVGKIVHAISGAIPAVPRSPSRRPNSLEAYDLFVRGRVLVSQWSEHNRAGRELLQGSIAIEPGFGSAYAWLACSHHVAWLLQGESPNVHRPQARLASERAVTLDRDSADACWSRGLVLAYDFQLAAGIASCERALEINPNHADVWIALADLRVLDGRPDEGVECARSAFRLNPYPPAAYRWHFAFALYAAGRYEEVLGTLRHEEMRNKGSQRLLAASLAQLGRREEAREEARQFLLTHPGFTASSWAIIHPFKEASNARHFVDGYIKAGLPP